MTHIYLDSSAIVKRYVAEKGTGWVQNLTNKSSGNSLYTVIVSPVEIVAAFFLRVRTGSISNLSAQRATTQLKSDIQSHFNLIEISQSLMASAMKLAEQEQLKGYDAIQLAAALALHQVRNSFTLSPIMFVSADERLNKSAVSVGLADIKDPNNF